MKKTPLFLLSAALLVRPAPADVTYGDLLRWDLLRRSDLRGTLTLDARNRRVGVGADAPECGLHLLGGASGDVPLSAFGASLATEREGYNKLGVYCSSDAESVYGQHCVLELGYTRAADSAGRCVTANLGFEYSADWGSNYLYLQMMRWDPADGSLSDGALQLMTFMGDGRVCVNGWAWAGLPDTVVPRLLIGTTSDNGSMDALQVTGSASVTQSATVGADLTVLGAARPAKLVLPGSDEAPEPGMIRFSPADGRFYGYDGSAWRRLDNDN